MSLGCTVTPRPIELSNELSSFEHALRATLDAKLGKANEVETSHESARSIAEQRRRCELFHTPIRREDVRYIRYFSDGAERQAHLDGDIDAELIADADEPLASEPEIEEEAVLAAKQTN